MNWEESLVALRTIDKCLRFYHENKPPKGSPELLIWESEIVHIRNWAVQIHLKRIEINIERKSCGLPLKPPQTSSR